MADSHWKITIEAWPKFVDIGDPGFTLRDLKEGIEDFFDNKGYAANVSVRDLREFVEGGR